MISQLRRDYRDILVGELPLMDVRAPVEFERGAFPNAVNLPLLEDGEREQVGIRYKQSGPAAAVELGHLLVRRGRARLLAEGHAHDCAAIGRPTPARRHQSGPRSRRWGNSLDGRAWFDP